MITISSVRVNINERFVEKYTQAHIYLTMSKRRTRRRFVCMRVSMRYILKTSKVNDELKDTTTQQWWMTSRNWKYCSG